MKAHGTTTLVVSAAKGARSGEIRVRVEQTAEVIPIQVTLR
jgi:hypothetical protein